MKITSIALILMMSSSLAHAQNSLDPYEDTAEFLTPQVELNSTEDISPNYKSATRRTGTWTYMFELVSADGSSKILNEANADVLVKPASTMKIFTGWWAFKLQNRNSVYLTEMLTKSVNAMADATVKRMGGVDAMEDYYTSLGLHTDDNNLITADGSGLSYNNKANCTTEIALLKLIRADADYVSFRNMMARPGREGTLKTRLKDLTGKVFAKTGTLNKTAALTGFMETSQGTVLFCVMSDYLTINLTAARIRIDNMVRQNYNLARKRNSRR